MQTVQELVPLVGAGSACDALAVPRSRFYRAQQPPRVKLPASVPKAPPPRALSADEKAVIRATLNSERFQDLAPREVYASLLDEGTYLCSWRGMYRILAENNEIRERRGPRGRGVPAGVGNSTLATMPRVSMGTLVERLWRIVSSTTWAAESKIACSSG